MSPVSLSPQGAKLPRFHTQQVTFSEGLETLHTGNYSRLFVHFVLRRQVGFYIIQIYLPAILTVVISWVSFWLSRDATPARVALGVTTVLTMTTLMTMSTSSLPKVSYVKSIDIFMITCFLMVFASLLEFAAVGVFNRRIRKLELIAAIKGAQDASAHPMSEKFKEAVNRRQEQERIEAGHDNEIISIEDSHDVDEAGPTSKESQRVQAEMMHMMLSSVSTKARMNAKIFQFGVLRPSVIDKVARIAFPLIFTIFNIGYWTAFSHLRQKSDRFT